MGALGSRCGSRRCRPASVETAGRTITLTPWMKYLNVACGETAAFGTGSKTVGCKRWGAACRVMAC
ncbi:CzcE family metal-binding protein [Cupriavidus sp. CuC1]|uniref:CzcE family metal-binding protein n=1 Tax=Cupriavidus sp. CuC1 TaxID=3373131 RepID=UPI0037D8C678